MKHIPVWALTALSLAALCVPLGAVQTPAAVSTAASVALLPNTAVWPLAACALLMGYRALCARPRPFARASLWLLSLLFALIVALGRSFAACGSPALLLAGRLRAAVFVAGRVPLYYMGMALLSYALQKPAAAPRPAWGWALALLALWSPWLYIVWPGTVSNDSLTMLAEALGAKPLSNGNPLFQTGLLDAFVRIGRLFGSDELAVALYVLAQAALMAWLLGVTLHRLPGVGAPRWLTGAAFALYGLCPVFPLYAFCVGKDTSFAMACLWLALCCWQWLAGERRGPWQVVWLCLSAVLCALLRNPGVYLAGLTLLLLLVTMLRRHSDWRAPALALLLAVGAALGVRWVAAPALGAAPMPESENWSAPLQQVARCVANGELTEAEKQTLSAVMNPDAVKAAYNGELSDPVKDLWNEQASPESKRAFFRLWLRLLAEHPATCLSASFHNAYGYLYPGYVSTLKPTLLVGAQGRTALLDGRFAVTVNPRAEAFKQTLQTLYDQPLFRLLVAPGLYGWLTLIAFALMLTRRRRALCCLTPALFTLAGCLLSAVNGYFRYAMPLYFCAPLGLALCAGANQSKTEVSAK